MHYVHLGFSHEKKELFTQGWSIWEQTNNLERSYTDCEVDQEMVHLSVVRETAGR